MAPNIASELARTLARTYNLNEAKLTRALKRAMREYVFESRGRQGIKERAEHVREVRKLRRAVANVQAKWAKLGPEMHQSLKWFDGKAKVISRIDSHLLDLFSLFDEYVDWNKRLKGNQGESRLVEGEFISAVIQFCDPLIEQWREERGALEVDVGDRGDLNNATAPDGMMFLLRAAAGMIRSDFPIGVIETAAREVVRPRRRRLKKQPPPAD